MTHRVLTNSVVILAGAVCLAALAWWWADGLPTGTGPLWL